MKALERAGTTYRNAVGRIMEEDAQGLVPCPRCNAPTLGLVFPPDVAPVDDETREAVLASMGLSREAAPPLREAEAVVMCDRCDGYGQLRYPTRNEHVTTQMCPACQGNGYKNVETQQTNVVSFQQQQGTGTGATDSSVTFTMPDSWGRPFGHRHYGTPPAEVG